MIVAGVPTCQFPAVLLYFLLRLFLRSWLRPQIKCKKCHAVGHFTQEKGYPLKQKKKVGSLWTYHYVCRHCGHVKEEKVFKGKENWFSGSSSSDRNNRRSSWSSGRSSSSGGSWGGGRSGGGGASTRF